MLEGRTRLVLDFRCFMPVYVLVYLAGSEFFVPFFFSFFIEPSSLRGAIPSSPLVLNFNAFQHMSQFLFISFPPGITINFFCKAPTVDGNARGKTPTL